MYAVGPDAHSVALHRLTLTNTVYATQATEWYAPENAPLFEYFESLDELAYQLRRGDSWFAARRRGIEAWAEAHTNTTLARWRSIDRHLVSRQS